METILEERLPSRKQELLISGMTSKQGFPVCSYKNWTRLSGNE